MPIGENEPAAEHSAVRTVAESDGQNSGVEQHEAQQPSEPLATDSLGSIPPIPHPVWHPLRAIAWLARMAFGIVSLIFLLSVVAAIPLVNFLALGYLLEVEGRIARTGKLRYAFPLLDLAPRIGSIALGIWVCVVPIRLLASAAADARLIDPGSTVDGVLHSLTLVAAIAVALHICLALARGGGIGCFCRPIKNGRWLLRRLFDAEYWKRAERAVRDFIRGLRLKHHFSLGFRGFLGAALWLVVPTILYSSLENTEEVREVFVALVGGLLLLLVFAWMPFLQARFAAENHFRAMFELRTVRELFRRTPVAWLFALVIVYTLALPLYLFKIILPP